MWNWSEAILAKIQTHLAQKVPKLYNSTNILYYKVSQKKGGFTTIITSSKSHFFLGHLVCHFIIDNLPHMYHWCWIIWSISKENKNIYKNLYCICTFFGAEGLEFLKTTKFDPNKRIFCSNSKSKEVLGQEWAKHISNIGCFAINFLPKIKGG